MFRRLFIYLVLIALLPSALAARRRLLAQPAPVATGSGGSVICNYINRYATNTAGTSYTFPNAALGTAAVNRVIWILTGSRANGTTQRITNVTVQGISATLAGECTNITTTTTCMTAWYVNVPTGTTGDVVVSYNESTIRGGIGIFSVFGQSSFAHAEDNTSAAPMTTISGSLNGALISGIFTSSAMVSTWVGVTEDYDMTIGTGAQSGGHGPAMPGMNMVTATVGGNAAMVTISISP